jgi:ferredoxin
MNEWLEDHLFSPFILSSDGMMAHAGLPPAWILSVLCAMAFSAIWVHRRQPAAPASSSVITDWRWLGAFSRWALSSPWVQTAFRLVVAAVFLLAIAAGLWGSDVPERNLATTLTWTIWWTGVIVVIYFVGTAWCAVCPWDSIASWLVRRRLWRRGSETTSLGLRVPRSLRSVWPAIVMFVVLTWFELGWGITIDPYATAVLALLFIMLATFSQLLFERKAFCRYFCSVGRTIGAYAELSPVSLRPLKADVCASCETLDCYHGNEEVEPCPTHLLMGTLHENRYCTSCGACTFSCPHQNITWRWQPHRVSEVGQQRLNSPEAWFILVLTALTLFHGLTMLNAWDHFTRVLTARIDPGGGHILLAFSAGMLLSILVPIALYAAAIKLTQALLPEPREFKRLFSFLALPLLPLAFSYHIAHNLTHLIRESRGLMEVALNPFGVGALPLSMTEKHSRHMNPILPDDITFALQSMLVIVGFYWSLRILQRRISLVSDTHANWRPFSPVLAFIVVTSLLSLWLMMQPMTIRM